MPEVKRYTQVRRAARQIATGVISDCPHNLPEGTVAYADEGFKTEYYGLLANMVGLVVGRVKTNFFIPPDILEGKCQVPVLLTNLSKTRFAYSNLN